jgi:hypothetical protein
MCVPAPPIKGIVYGRLANAFQAYGRVPMWGPLVAVCLFVGEGHHVFDVIDVEGHNVAISYEVAESRSSFVGLDASDVAFVGTVERDDFGDFDLDSAVHEDAEIRPIQ